MIGRPPRSTLFPTRRSSDLVEPSAGAGPVGSGDGAACLNCGATVTGAYCSACGQAAHIHRDRKSTRLNSSHSQISYAVFCLKKKSNNNKLLLVCIIARLQPT